MPMEWDKCNTSTCSSCRQLMTLHTNDSKQCPFIPLERLRLPGVTIVNCPKCWTAAEKSLGGCDELICPICHATFCPKCGASTRPHVECDHFRDESDLTDWAGPAAEEERVMESDEEDDGRDDEENGVDEMRDYGDEEERDDDRLYKTDDEHEEGRAIQGGSRKHPRLSPWGAYQTCR